MFIVIFRAVAFDIDGTLYPSMGLYFRNLGFGFRNYRMLRAFAKVRYQLHQMSMDPSMEPGMPSDLPGFRALQARILADGTSLSFEEAFSWAERTMYGELEASFHDVRLFHGVRATLDAFAASGLRLAALSDFPAPRKLEILGIRDYFEVAMSSEETGFLKPASRPFLTLAERLGVAPGELCYVGNSSRLDVAGAKAVGMGTALRGSSGFFRGSREPYAPKEFNSLREITPDMAFTDWRDLVNYILPGPARSGRALGVSEA
ncbi:MAG: HAD family hydrolase [Spirochaetota bacterium]